MARHHEILRGKYSKILKEELQTDDVIGKLSADEIEVIHSHLVDWFGSSSTNRRIKSSLKKMIEKLADESEK